MEILKREKGEQIDQLAARIIKERAKGRCEYEWFEGMVKRRCCELEGEPGREIKGIVRLALMPTAGLNDRRVCNQKAYCQRHAYQLLAYITSTVKYKKITKDKDSTQIRMFENVL